MNSEYNSFMLNSLLISFYSQINNKLVCVTCLCMPSLTSYVLIETLNVFVFLYNNLIDQLEAVSGRYINIPQAENLCSWTAITCHTHLASSTYGSAGCYHFGTF